MDFADIKFWKMKNVIVDKWYSDRIFLIGDASHQYPPSGGYGLNTGITDAFSLAWVLKYILENKSDRNYEEILKKNFETERVIHSTVIYSIINISINSSYQSVPNIITISF